MYETLHNTWCLPPTLIHIRLKKKYIYQLPLKKYTNKLQKRIFCMKLFSTAHALRIRVVYLYNPVVKYKE